MPSTLERVVDIAVNSGLADRSKCQPHSAIHPDLGINGDEGKEFVDALCAEFGDWIADSPWSRFVDFNEPLASLGSAALKFLRLLKPEIAFAGYVEERLKLGHIAAVIEKGEWFEP